MKRLPGITVSAIVLLLGSLLQVLFAFGMVSAGLIERSQIHSGSALAARAGAPLATWMPGFMFGMSVFFVALALWGVATAVGLFRLRRWALYSMLVIGGGLLLIGLPSMLAMLAMTMVPLPLPASVDASQAQAVHTMTRIALGIGAAFYGTLSAVGVWWLIYFNRKKVCDVFAGESIQAVQNRRPFLISVVAVLSLIGGASCLLMAFLPFPGGFFGFILHGWQRAAVYLVFAALMIGAGVGLWKLEEWGRRLAMAIQVVGLAQYVVFLLRPSLLTDLIAEVNRTLNANQPQLPAKFQILMFDVSSGFGMLIVIAFLWILIHYRNVFSHPLAPPRVESPA